ncbi:MAG: DUF465 domain-containing protein [Paracoccaceae bacterium]|nr:DUF465 domain-containing protein [Paracoccaceae bacterium]MDE3121664.1 DUF465 domain-containing protein [Paracoccaceae bacterium]MDE3241033.1 DUF465 domain-containing protein [Paracoccaceae bacterium]
MSISENLKASIAARIDALRHRHRQIDMQVTREQKHPWRDLTLLQRLKRRRLRLKEELDRHEGLLRTLSRPRSVH